MQRSRGGAAPAGPQTLLTFKAGKLTASLIPESTKLRIEADPRRGVVALERAVDSSLHLLIKDRVTLQILDDFLVFPQDQKVERIDTGRPNDRVYLLSFSTSDAMRVFLWMQEPDASKDDERVAELNRLMNTTATAPARGQPARVNAPATVAPQVSAMDLGNILDSMGLAAPQPPAAPSATEQARGLTQEDLNKAFRDVALAMKTPSLSEVLTAEELDRVFADPSVHASFLALLPEDRRTEDELLATIHSPQLRQALDSLSKALQSENLEAILAGFDLDPSAGADALAHGDGIGAFIAAILAKFADDNNES